MKLRSTIFLSLIAFAGLSSCKSQKEIVEKTKIEKTSEKTTAMKSTIGIPYFKAIGTEPFWGVEISEKELKFTSVENQNGIIIPNDNFEKFEENKKITFATKDYMLIIEAKPGECSDDMSDRRYSHKVVVTFIDEKTGEATENYGCGEFFADPQLSNIWMLKTLLGQDISAKYFGNEIPFIEFIGEKNMFTGFAGCNRINGKMQANSGNRLQLVDIASTKMMCEPENKEEQFLNVLPKVDAYKFDGDTLILMDATYVPVAIFKKK